jgi:hypothetical protein
LVAWSAGSGCCTGSFMASRVVRRRKRREWTLEGLEGLEAFLWEERKTAQIRMIFLHKIGLLGEISDKFQFVTVVTISIIVRFTLIIFILSAL